MNYYVPVIDSVIHLRPMPTWSELLVNLEASNGGNNFPQSDWDGAIALAKSEIAAGNGAVKLPHPPYST